MQKTYERKQKEAKPVVAICYDFDKTLSPNDMQAHGFIQSLNKDVGEFWKESNGMAIENDMDQNLSYMFKMIRDSEGRFYVTKEKLEEYGAGIELFPGVVEWFERIKKYGEEHGVIVEHYIISSGLKEMIEGTSMAKAGAFTKIYASSFYYGKSGKAEWPAQVVNFTNKTQFLFRIEKGVLDINDQGVNEYFEENELRVPFRNMIYIGDSDTDIPCMKLVNSHGGYSIGVYNPDTNEKTKVYKMIENNRIKFFTSADYTEGSELDGLVKKIIDRTSVNELIEVESYKCKNEVRNSNDDNLGMPDETKQVDELILLLESSSTFVNTHQVIAKLSKYDELSNKQTKKLVEIAINNSQVRWILEDEDIADFYLNIYKKLNDEDDKVQLEKVLNQNNVNV